MTFIKEGITSNQEDLSEFTVGKLNLLAVKDSSIENSFRVSDIIISRSKSEIHTNVFDTLNNSKNIETYFEGINIIKTDGILRPQGDSTIFTTAGVQHVETILRETGELSKSSFMIPQPVVRSQFMDKVKEGTSTSFINFSIESIRSTPDEYVTLSQNLIKFIIDCGAQTKDLTFHLNNSSDKWGDKSFTNSSVAIYLNDIQLGECIYIHDYPVSKKETISIADICFGVERLSWGINQGNYFPDFDKFYLGFEDKNKAASIIDCIRTSVLIAGDGVIPSHRDPGYRLRQLSKRFVERSKGFQINLPDLIHISYEYWKKWGFIPSIDEKDIFQLIQSENERSHNVSILSTINKSIGINLNLDVNQSAEMFLRQVSLLPKDLRSKIYKLIGE